MNTVGVRADTSRRSGTVPSRQSDWRRRVAPLAAAIAVALALGAPGAARAAEVARISIAYLSQVVERPPKLSNLVLPPDDEGFAGGRLSIGDNNTTGRFLNQKFVLNEVDVPVEGDPKAAFQALLDAGEHYVVLNVPAQVLLDLADMATGREVMLFNAGAPDDRLRDQDCRDNVMHLAPSRAMLADGLAQYLAWKRWTRWFLVVGRRDSDALFAEALHRAAKRFGNKIVDEKRWDYGPDARRTAQAEVPAFTQVDDYDLLIVADEIGEFGEYLAYRTWLPRPIAGTQGLTPTSWHFTHEQWGAVQLQSRFHKAYGRWMTPLDYHVWAAIRAIGEGATRAGSTEFAAIRDYIRGPNFELAGFKGQKLTFRPWNWQLRQPILLASPTAMVSVSPQQGFLHPVSFLDTLGVDKPETKCDIL